MERGDGVTERLLLLHHVSSDDAAQAMQVWKRDEGRQALPLRPRKRRETCGCIVRFSKWKLRAGLSRTSHISVVNVSPPPPLRHGYTKQSRV